MMEDRDTPNSLAQLTPPEPGRYERLDCQIGRLLATHPERREAYCAIALSLASGVGRWGDEATVLAHNVLEFAARTRDGTTDCVPQVIAALPPTPEFREIVKDIRSACRFDWQGSNCGELRLKLTGGGSGDKLTEP